MIDPIEENKGKRIVMSPEGISHLKPRDDHRFRCGEVKGFSFDRACVRVQWDGAKSMATYHASFLRFATEEDEEFSEELFREARQRELENPEIPDPPQERVPTESLPEDQQELLRHAGTRENIPQGEGLRPEIEKSGVDLSILPPITMKMIRDREEEMIRLQEEKKRAAEKKYNDTFYKAR